MYCHLVVLCCYVSVLLKALKTKKKNHEKKNCVQVFYLKKNNKVKMFQAYFLFINVTFTGIYKKQNLTGYLKCFLYTFPKKFTKFLHNLSKNPTKFGITDE